MNKSTLVGTILVACTPCAGLGQLPEFRTSQDRPAYDLDVVNLASGDRTLSRLDVYLKIKYSELQFIKSSGGRFLGRYEVSVEVFDQRNRPADGSILRKEILAKNVDETTSTLLFSSAKLSFDLPPASYRVSIDLRDLETEKKSRQERTIILQDYSDPEVAASDILFLDQVSRGLNGQLSIRPRVSSGRRYNSDIYAYFEIYGVPEYDSIHVHYRITEEQEEELVLADEFWTKSSGAVTNTVVEIPANSFRHGKYNTEIQVRHGETTLNLASQFSWYWTDLPAFFSDLDEAIEVLRYLVSEKDLVGLKGASESQKHRQLTEFWKRHDPTPATNENEYRDEYYRRISYANQNYRGLRKKGWETDMGWVYIRLGAADAIDRRPYLGRIASDPGRAPKAYEIWDYFAYSRKFIFIDENGFGEFRLENPQTLHEVLSRSQ